MTPPSKPIPKPILSTNKPAPKEVNGLSGASYGRTLPAPKLFNGMSSASYGRTPPTMPKMGSVSDPMPTMPMPPTGTTNTPVDDLDFIKKITSNQPRNTSGSTPKITPYYSKEKNLIPTSTSKPVQNNTPAPYPDDFDLTMKKGGSFKTTKMSTHEKNPKHKNCW